MLPAAASSFIFSSIILIPKVVPFLSFHKQSCLLQIVDAATDSDLSPITCCWQHMARISSSSRREQEQEQLLRIAVAWHVARKWSRSESEARTPQGACLSQFVMKHATDRERGRGRGSARVSCQSVAGRRCGWGAGRAAGGALHLMMMLSDLHRLPASPRQQLVDSRRTFHFSEMKSVFPSSAFNLTNSSNRCDDPKQEAQTPVPPVPFTSCFLIENEN